MNKLADAVRVTLGPKGRNVMIGRGVMGPLITNDGVSIAAEIELDDPHERLGADLVKEVAKKTDQVAGDGTTTATVLGWAMVHQGLRNVVAGANPVALKVGMQDAATVVLASLKEVTQEITTQAQIAQVATISAADEEIGNVIGEAMARVGKDGIITVQESQSFGIQVEFVEGILLRNGYLSAQFVNEPARLEVVLEDPLIMISASEITSARELIPVLETAMRVGHPLVVIAPQIEADALALMLINQARGLIKAVAVKAPGVGERRAATLSDVAVLVGAQVVSEDVGLRPESVTLNHLGRARRVVVTKDDTTIIDGKGYDEQVAKYIAQLRTEMDLADRDFEKQVFQDRLARMLGGVAIIKVGAATEPELEEKKHRITDAVSTTKGAVAEGIVPGGGVALLRAQKGLLKWLNGTPEPRLPAPAFPPSPARDSDTATGAKIVARALEEPLRQIAENSGMEGGVTVEKVRDMEGAMGLNGETGEYEDLMAAGIIDAAKVTRSALENAVSIAAMFLTTEVIVADGPDQISTGTGAPQTMDDWIAQGAS